LDREAAFDIQGSDCHVVMEGNGWNNINYKFNLNICHCNFKHSKNATSEKGQLNICHLHSEIYKSIHELAVAFAKG
jgi:hypothetical protein